MNSDFITLKSKDYELLDSGFGEKLERYGEVLLSRPDTQAIWNKKLSKERWEKVDATFVRTSVSGKWKIFNEEKIKEDWSVSLLDLNFSLKLLPSKHLGVFPEQVMQWQWLEEKIKNQISPVSVLNLFAHTGGASLACSRAGATVCHVDSSEFAVDLAKKNFESSGLGKNLVRFIVDDVRKFVEREIKRGNKYDVVILDPPVYGKGSKKEIWKIEKDLFPLLQKLTKIVTPKPLAVVMNGYASVYSHITYRELLLSAGFFGKASSGEFLIEEYSGRRLPCGIFAKIEN